MRETQGIAQAAIFEGLYVYLGQTVISLKD